MRRRRPVFVLGCCLLALGLVGGSGATVHLAALDPGDRATIRSLHSSLKESGRALTRQGQAYRRQLANSMKTCRGYARNVRVAQTAASSIASINANYHFRKEMAANTSVLRAARFSDPALAKWLASFNRALAHTEKAGLGKRYLNRARACSVVGAAVQRFGTKPVTVAALQKVVTFVARQSGLNWSSLQAANREIENVFVMAPLVTSLFIQAGLTEEDANALANGAGYA